MHRPAEDWPFDADPADPLAELRIPVTTARPRQPYIACFDRDSPARPTDTEAQMIASFIQQYLHAWHTEDERAHLARQPLDTDPGSIPVIFRKWGDGDWSYRRDSWDYGRIWVPSDPAIRGTTGDPRGLSAHTLLQVMDRAHGDGHHAPGWEEWKAAHPDVFDT
ncbi:hypothetical protein F0L17_14610 [Streptomyces sp. TRM43335]|uniref:Uncharacterized protein n=1 Tax=Streptomyces taklimakanensis TaxID=2569853 RepID=A0A6G2BDG8_9ACTN|nr:hypothetical protein [Streptomyces taklimakanensis]MTE20317.1 hypothetical protein [Streptomyces taklimakanensis]